MAKQVIIDVKTGEKTEKEVTFNEPSGFTLVDYIDIEELKKVLPQVIKQRSI